MTSLRHCVTVERRTCVDADDPSCVQLLMSMEQQESGMNGGTKMASPAANNQNNNKREFEYPDIRGDRLNIFMLSFLYLLQGTMFGLVQAIPIILQNRKASYEDQAEFSIVNYPASFKVLWAPIVDCMYLKKLGRRKTWLIPMQYLIGFFLCLLAMNVNTWLGSEDGTQKAHIHLLTLVVLLCALFTATHDIALDAWAITMLQKRNIGHSGTCQSIGNAVGQFLAFFLLIILNSKDFSNKFRSVPQDQGFVPVDKFLFFWAFTFLISTTIIFIFKKETATEDADVDLFENRMSIKQSYKHLWKVLQIPQILMICFILFTCRIGFGPVNGVAPLKLIDAGVSSENFALLTAPSLPFQLILPFALSRYLTGPRSMRAFIIIYILKLISSVTFAAFIFFTPYVKDANRSIPLWYYWLLLFVYNVQTVGKFSMAISAQAFFSRVSDPRFGGMYLTLLNTATNLGSQWPISVCLWAVDKISIRSCRGNTEMNGNECPVLFDGYYTETIFCTVIGALWLHWGRKLIYKLEMKDPSSWIPPKKSEESQTIQDEKLPFITRLYRRFSRLFCDPFYSS